jgi:tRNA dimethylallyltransferase
MTIFRQKKLIVIAGATAIGKTALAIQLAQHFQTDILSADSRQFFKEMSIGTAKPSAEELAAAPHHFIGQISVHDYYSVGDYERDALAKLDTIFEEKDVAIMVGGSGLYINAVCKGLDVFPDVPDIIREDLQVLYEEKGIFALQQELAASDPIYYSEADINNPHRLLRALGVCRASGAAYSSFKKMGTIQRSFSITYILLDAPRAVLYERINQRVHTMMAAGLLKEAQQLYPLRHLNALQTVGYQELFDYFEGKITLEKATELIQQHTRNYAKRQVTWFNKGTEWQKFSPNDVQGIIDYVVGKFISS